MRKPERRKQRSEKAHLALNLYLESIRESEGFKALAVTTDDGFLVAGAGVRETDVEWMGAIGASSKRKTLEWEDDTLHIQALEVNHVPMFLTSTGKRANLAAVKKGLERILAA
ncbi:MAG: hypothetical protein U0228_29135 [Myxococcaceae bacterium]